MNLAAFSESIDERHDSGCKRLLNVPKHWDVDCEFYGKNDIYRPKLMQRWKAGRMALFLMMNPSGAGTDPYITDSTVHHTSKIASNLGYGGQFIGNACDYRLTQSKELVRVKNPCSDRNHAAIAEMAEKSDLIIIASGKLHGRLQIHANRVIDLVRSLGREMHVLGLTAEGFPMHPLARGKHRIPSTVVPQPWSRS